MSDTIPIPRRVYDFTRAELVTLRARVEELEKAAADHGSISTKGRPGEIVERVARALAGSDADRPGPFSDDCGRTIADGEFGWTACVDDARAAIAALRTPTEAMQAALTSYAVCAGYIEGWAAAIDSALQDR